MEMTTLEFRRDFWQQKTRVPGLSYRVACVILRLAVLVQFRLVTDRQTDGRTYDNSIYRASIGSRGNNGFTFTARRYASAVYTLLSSYVCLSVCLSVCPLQAGTVPKRLNIGSRK